MMTEQLPFLIMQVKLCKMNNAICIIVLRYEDFYVYLQQNQEVMSTIINPFIATGKVPAESSRGAAEKHLCNLQSLSH